MKIVYIILMIIYIIGCNDSSPPITKQSSQPTKIVTDNSINDSLHLDSLLYKSYFRLPEMTCKKVFTYELDFDSLTNDIKIVAKNKISDHHIVYKVNLKYVGDKFVQDKFYLYDDSSYVYENAEIRVDLDNILLSDISFINDTNEKIFIAGLWHWSAEGASIKYYQYNNREYYLLNGAELLCNGSHCTSFQLYILVRYKGKLTFNPFLLDGIWPYQFENISLIDIENDGYPEIYIAKNNISEIKSKNDFFLYSFDKLGKVYLQENK